MSTEPMDADERGPVLLRLARASLTEALGLPPTPATAEAAETAPEAWLRDPGATFVTLHKDGSLRGCIGSVNAYRPLADDVRENARAAAFSDYRFPPVTAEELPRLRLEVSLLSHPEPLAAAGEAEACAALRPGVDGVILECGGRRATFRAQVGEQLPEPRDFLAHLKHKAGLPRRFWSPDVQLWRYTVEKWEEPPADPRAAG
jgi:AmmeMemoRadiSam system protein A